jgi:hypothetical protein
MTKGQDCLSGKRAIADFCHKLDKCIGKLAKLVSVWRAGSNCNNWVIYSACLRVQVLPQEGVMSVM